MPVPARREPAADRPDPKPETDADPSSQAQEDAIAALRSLGYRDRDAREAVERCGLPPDATAERWVRAALAYRVRHLLARSARTAAAPA